MSDIAADEHGAITDGPFGSFLKSDHYTSSGVRVIRLGNIGLRKFISDGEAFIGEKRFEELRRHEAGPGDLVTAALGEPLGRTALVPANYGLAIVKADCFRLRPSANVDKELLLYWLNSPAVLRSFVDRSQGIGRVRINLSTFRTTSLLLPPLAEQHRIVAKLDTLNACIVRTRTELARVRTLVRRTKLSALTTCFATRSDRPTIPLGAVLQGVQAGKNLRCEERPPLPGELGVIKVSAVTWGRFDPTKAKTLPPDYTPSETARIGAGDLLVSRANTIELVGAVAMVEQAPRDLFLSDKILRLVVANDAKRWILWFLRSPSGREQIERMATGNQLSMRNISQDALRRIELPFPEAAARLSAVNELEAAFARADRLEAEAARTSNLLDRLEASILAKAFHGELVPQDPADEPASALLNRIRVKRASAPKSRRGRDLAVPVAAQ